MNRYEPPYMVVPMPINKNGGGGPETDEDKVVSIKYQIWDIANQTVSEHDTELEAKIALDKLNNSIKIIKVGDFYDTCLSGLCLYKGEKKYFHFMEEAEPSPGKTYREMIYYVYDIDYIPSIKCWKELDQFKLIGKFKESDIDRN